MAEAFLRTYAAEKYEAFSAGVNPKEVHHLTTKVMDEIGVDISGQRSKAFREYMGRIHFGYLITVCSEAEEACPRTFPGVGRRLHWDFEDPAAYAGTEEEKLNKFREIRDLIRVRVKEWVDSQT